MKHEYDLNAIEDRLLHIRRSTGMNQSEFAKSVGFKHRTYVGWERGDTRPPVELMAALHKKFDVDLHWLVLGPGYEKQSDDISFDKRRYTKIFAAVDDITTNDDTNYSFNQKALLALGVLAGPAENDDAILEELKQWFVSAAVTAA